MSGDDEDRLDFGEDEELEDQISLGDADEAPGWQGAQQQDMQIDAQVVKQPSDSDAGQVTGPASQAVSEENSKEASLPAGWVTRVSRQGEMYYFHEATLTSQWDRPTAPMKAGPQAVESKSPAPTRSEPVQDVAAASTSQDSAKANVTSNASREAASSTKWGRQSQPLEAQAFPSRAAETADKPKSAREVAEAAGARQSASSSDKSRLPGVSDKVTADPTGRASPAIPTGPRNARDPPTGPRNQPQDSARWPARDSQSSQPKLSATLPTGPAADRNRGRGFPPTVDRTSDREPVGPASVVARHNNAVHRGDSGWPSREPVGPPADLVRASNSGFRVNSASRDMRDRDYDDSRRLLRDDSALRERAPDSGYRNTANSARDTRATGRDPRDEGWSRRPPREDFPVDIAPRRRDPSPPRRPRSPLPARRESALANERRRRSPSPPPRIVRDHAETFARPPPSRDYGANADRNPKRPRRSPSPLPMRKWAVRAITPPVAAGDASASPEKLEHRAEVPTPTAQKGNGVSESRTATAQDTRSEVSAASTTVPEQEPKAEGGPTKMQHELSLGSEYPARQPARGSSESGEKQSEPAGAPPPPIKREKRPESPGLASRLDRPLSQPTPRDARIRRGRTPPPTWSSRRSPSPDAQRRRPAAQPGPSLAERMGGGQRGEPSLLSRLGQNGKGDNNWTRAPPIESRPSKRSKKDDTEYLDQRSEDFQKDADQLSRRIQAPRSRSQSPNRGSQGITIMGAGRSRLPPPSLERRVAEGDSSMGRNTNDAYQGRSTQQSYDLIGTEVTAELSVGAKPGNTSVPSSNGLTPRPAGFASLPPRPPVVVPPPDYSTVRSQHRGGSTTPNPALLDSYRPGPPPRRPSSRGPPVLDSYQPAPAKEALVLDRYVPGREPLPSRGARPRSPPPFRGPPRRDYR